MKMPKSLKFNLTSSFQKVRRSTAWAVLCLAVCILGLGVSAMAQVPRIIEFEVPGAGTSADQGTQGPGLNPEGAIAGYYADSNNVMHGFLRTPDGKFTTFDAPGAGSESVTGFYGTPAGVMGGQGTYAISINPWGAISGTYLDADDVQHGFLRAPDGNFTTIDVPGAGTGPVQGTDAGNINAAGVIAGNYVDGNGTSHGFLRAPNGKFTTFNVPGAGNESGQGTWVAWASCLNTAGAIAGYYVDNENVYHGYVRAPDGAIAKFDVPGAGTGAGQGTFAWSISTAGAAIGYYIDADGVEHGYVRAANGAITKFDIPGAGTGAGQGTIPEGINSAGVIAGNYADDNGVNHAFVRTPDGNITRFDAPHAGTGAGQGTIPLTNNPAGAITGVFLDDGNLVHGFLRPAERPWHW